MGGTNAVRILRSTRLYYSQALSVQLLYRFPLAQSFVSVAIGFVGLGLFWVAVGDQAGKQGGYGPGMLLAYFIVASAHSLLQENSLSPDLNMSIRMGRLSSSLLRPYPFLLAVVASVAAQATIRLVLLVPILWVLFQSFAVLTPLLAQLGAGTLLVYGAALLISLAAGWLARIAIGLLAFDMTQTWGPELIFLSLYSALSGVAYPADMLPAWLAGIVPWTPVYYMVGFPTLLLLGRLTPEQTTNGLWRGALVAVLTGALVALMWRRGIKRFEAIGI